MVQSWIQHCALGGRSLAIALLGVNGLPAIALAQPAPRPPETVRINPNFTPNPLEISGVTGGAIAVQDVIGRKRTPTGMCLGYVDRTPDHILTLGTFFDQLNVRVESQEDTTLIVRGPGGLWCNDDTDGHNPSITGQWLQGTYQIWVGTYARNQSFPYTLVIEGDR